MDIKLFGLSLNVELIIIIIILFSIMSGHMVCACSRISAKEGFQILKESFGTEVDYNMSQDVYKSWGMDSKNYSKTAKNPGVPANIKKDMEGDSIPLDEGKLFFFGKTQFSPECCPGSYSNDQGCACMSYDQMRHINQRGGNRTHGNY